MIQVGELSLWVALLMAAWAATVSFAGGALGRRDLMTSGERAIYATLMLVGLASIGLWTALFTHDFSISYVASFSSANLPKVYTFAAFWSGQAGSILFSCLILAACSSVAVFRARSQGRELRPWISGTLAVVMTFFLAALCFAANPFTRLDWIPPDGLGMTPELQNPGMAIHPPSLYLGYAATAIAFAFATAALKTRRLDADWLATIRMWTLVSWFFMTVAILFGMWWAYVEAGSSGDWVWNPVRNASLLPWLANTALLHSIIVEERRAMLRKWNFALVLSAFLLSMVGIFITRSGSIADVGTLAKSSLGIYIAAFVVATIGVTVYLVISRLDDLRPASSFESVVSRESALLSINVILAAIALAVVSGMGFTIVPLGLVLVLLMGIGPLVAWRRVSVPTLRRQLLMPLLAALTTGVLLLSLAMRDASAVITYVFAAFAATTVIRELYTGVVARMRVFGERATIALAFFVSRNNRRFGGYVVHIGVVVIVAAFAGLAFSRHFDLVLGGGEAKELVDPYGHTWRVTSQGMSRYDVLNREVTALALTLTRDGRRAGLLTTEKRQYVDSRGAPTFDPSTEAGIRGSWRQDVYVSLAAVRDDGSAQIRVTFSPLVRWVWLGGGLIALGGLILMWPQSDPGHSRAGYSLAALGSLPREDS